MTPAHHLLTVQFLGTLHAGPRPYAEVLEGWRSSCPRLAVWEDSLADGLVRIVPGEGPMAQAAVALTPAGQALLGRRSLIG